MGSHLLITLRGLRALTSLKTRSIPNILLFFPTIAVIVASGKINRLDLTYVYCSIGFCSPTNDMITKVPSILFQLSLKYAVSPKT